MASTTLSGPLTSTAGFVGAVTGAVTGNVTGNVTGDVTGNLTGNVVATSVVATSGQNLAINSGTTATDVAGKTIRLNSITNIGTANSFIGFQSKPAVGASTANDVIGGEISPRVNDTFALTTSGSIIGLHVDAYLKGTTGNIAGDVRGVQIEMVDDTGSSRTVSGNVAHIRIRSNISYTVSGKYSVIRVENEEGTKAMDALFQFTTGSGCLVEANGTVGGTQNQAVKILIGTTTYYIPLHTAVS